jgi:hypothetical protein
MGLFDNLPYGSTRFLDSSKQFLTSNNLVAQIVFFILIIILFVIFVRVGSVIISYVLSPSPNPYLINGMIDATKQHTIAQDPKIKGAIPILRSNDQTNGLEFTWNTWIFVDGVASAAEHRYKHIFNKGNHTMGVDGIAAPNNAPGLYLSPVGYPTQQEMGLLVRMNIFTNQNIKSDLVASNETCRGVANNEFNGLNNNSSLTESIIEQCQKQFPALNAAGGNIVEVPGIYDDIEIPGVPLNKWVNIIIRCSANNIMDVYINGRLVKRKQLRGVARQNYDDVYVALQGGFPGFISNLKYFNYAIGTGEIDSIVRGGPNLTPVGGTDLTASKPQYLSNRWFFNEADPLFSTNIV